MNLKYVSYWLSIKDEPLQEKKFMIMYTGWKAMLYIRR